MIFPVESKRTEASPSSTMGKIVEEDSKAFGPEGLFKLVFIYMKNPWVRSASADCGVYSINRLDSRNGYIRQDRGVRFYVRAKPLKVL